MSSSIIVGKFQECFIIQECFELKFNCPLKLEVFPLTLAQNTGTGTVSTASSMSSKRKLETGEILACFDSKYLPNYKYFYFVCKKEPLKM